jgi:hypothetical protein
MPNGNGELTAPELDALLRRSALLAAKVKSLEDSGFSRQEAMQILFADIEAGLTEFGTPSPAASGTPTSVTPPRQAVDLSTLIGTWTITPAVLKEQCHAGGVAMPGVPTFDLEAATLEISPIGQGVRYQLIFKDAAGAGTRADGQMSALGNTKFDFVGTFDQSGVRLRLQGNAVSGDLEVVFTFEYRGTPLDINMPFFSACDDATYPRTLVRV